MTEHEKIQAINATLKEWFALNRGVHSKPAKELMELFIRKGIFTANHRDGLPIRDLLRSLDKANRLSEIPFVQPERKAQNVYWYFQRLDYKLESEHRNAPFNNTNLERLRNIAASINDTPSSYNYYTQALKFKPDPDTEEGLYMAISIAYSWMPTMLTIYMPEGKTLQDYIEHVLYFKSCSKVDLLRDNQELRKHLSPLVSLINNSVVGASKVLHILYPDTVPIIDSRVIRGWNSFFSADLEQYRNIKLLPSFTSIKPERQIEEYIHYWDMLNKWMRATGVNNIRELEYPFYLIGKEN